MILLRKELTLFLTAVMFLTRIPVPSQLPYSEEILSQSSKYFSWVGVLIGMFAAGVVIGGIPLFGKEASVILSIGVTLLLTGAFHEDGFTDACDGLGGAWKKEDVLRIMKDSRIGSYGTVALWSLLTLKFVLLKNLSEPLLLLSLIVGHSGSRAFALSFLNLLPYVQETEVSKIKPLAQRISVGGNWFSVFPSLVLLFLFPLGVSLACLVFIPARWILRNYLNGRIGGYTGDTLGWLQQISEVLFYLLVTGVSLNG